MVPDGSGADLSYGECSPFFLFLRIAGQGNSSFFYFPQRTAGEDPARSPADQSVVIVTARLFSVEFPFSFPFPEFPDQTEKSCLPVAELGAFFRCLGAFAGGQMGDPDGGIGFVEMLSAVSGSASCFHSELRIVKFLAGGEFDLRDSCKPVLARMMRPEGTWLNPLHCSGPAPGEGFRRFASEPQQNGGVSLFAGFIQEITFEVIVFSFPPEKNGKESHEQTALSGALPRRDL